MGLLKLLGSFEEKRSRKKLVQKLHKTEVFIDNCDKCSLHRVYIKFTFEAFDPQRGLHGIQNKFGHKFLSYMFLEL